MPLRADQPLLVLVGTYGENLPHVQGEGEGVYSLLLDRRTLAPLSGSRFHGVAQLRSTRNPSWISSWRDPRTGQLYCYVADERTDAGLVFAARVDESSGELTPLGAPASAGGSGTCHCAVAPGGRHVVAANYGSGSVVAIERLPDGSLGRQVALVQLPPKGVLVETPIGQCEIFIRFPRVNAARQEGPHAHHVVFSPRRPTDHTAAEGVSYSLLVPDLGSDVVWALEYEPEQPQNVLRPAAATAVHGGVLDGGGCRHVALHPDPMVRVVYVAYELTSQVAAYAVDPSTGHPTGLPLPPGPVCVLDATGPPLVSAPGNSADPAPAPPPASAPLGLSPLFGPSGANAHCAPLVRRPAGRPAHCSDADTSVAALRVCPAAGNKTRRGGESNAGPSCCHLLVSSRAVGQDGFLSAIAIDHTGRLIPPTQRAPLGIASTLGRTPRDFVLVQRGGPGKEVGPVVALVANQDSGSVMAIPMTGTGHAAEVARVPTPACLCVAPEDSVFFAEPPYDGAGGAATGDVRRRVAAGVGVAVVAMLLLGAARVWAKK